MAFEPTASNSEHNMHSYFEMWSEPPSMDCGGLQWIEVDWKITKTMHGPQSSDFSPSGCAEEHSEYVK